MQPVGQIQSQYPLWRLTGCCIGTNASLLASGSFILVRKLPAKQAERS